MAFQGIAPSSDNARLPKLATAADVSTQPQVEPVATPHFSNLLKQHFEQLNPLQQKISEQSQSTEEALRKNVEEKKKLYELQRQFQINQMQSPLQPPQLLEQPKPPDTSQRMYLSGEGKNAFRQAVAGLSNLAMIFGGMGSPIAALNALSGAMEGWREGDVHRASRELKQYETQLENVRRKNEDALKAWEYARIARSDDMEMQKALLQTALLEADLPVHAAQIGEHGIDRALQMWELADKSISKIQDQDNRMIRNSLYDYYRMKHAEEEAKRNAVYAAKAGLPFEEPSGPTVMPIAGGVTPQARSAEMSQRQMSEEKSRAIRDKLGLMRIQQASQGLTDEAVEGIARRVLSGDRTALQNIGRGIQGAADLRKIQNKIYELGKKHNITPEQIASRVAEFNAMQVAQRALASREGSVAGAVQEAAQLIPVMKDAAARTPRSSWPIINKAMRFGAENVPMNPDTAAAWKQFQVAVNSFIPIYTRAMKGTGVPDVTSTEHARELLTTTLSPAQFDAALKQLQIEMDTALTAPERARDMIMKNFMKRVETPGTKQESTVAAPVEKKQPVDQQKVDELLKKYGKPK